MTWAAAFLRAIFFRVPACSAYTTETKARLRACSRRAEMTAKSETGLRLGTDPLESGVPTQKHLVETQNAGQGEPALKVCSETIDSDLPESVRP